MLVKRAIIEVNIHAIQLFHRVSSISVIAYTQAVAFNLRAASITVFAVHPEAVTIKTVAI